MCINTEISACICVIMPKEKMKLLSPSFLEYKKIQNMLNMLAPKNTTILRSIRYLIQYILYLRSDATHGTWWKQRLIIDASISSNE